MKSRSLALTLLLVISLLSVLPLCQASPQGSLTFSGHIKVNGTVNPQFSLRLYPPKKSNRPIILTTTNNAGSFQFTDLQASSYLLEIYLGAKLIYQEIVELNSNICCEIDLSGETGKRLCPCQRAQR